jgi:acyl phosphate:glycerol-3-phosphate acyltransferase
VRNISQRKFQSFEHSAFEFDSSFEFRHSSFPQEPMTPQQLILYILFPLAAYLLGSVPFAWIIGKAHGVDIRTTGSKNIGATNLARTLGPKFFWYAFLLDAAKGFVPVFLAAWFAQMGSSVVPFPAWAPLLTAMACVLGHNFPLWLKFKGGKGVATSFGVVLGFWPLYTLAGIGGGIVFLLVFFAYRYISLASMIGVAAFAVLVMLLGTGHFDGGSVHLAIAWPQLQPLVIIALLFTGLIVFRHRANIARLLKGTEPKWGSAKPKNPN